MAKLHLIILVMLCFGHAGLLQRAHFSLSTWLKKGRFSRTKCRFFKKPKATSTARLRVHSCFSFSQLQCFSSLRTKCGVWSRVCVWGGNAQSVWSPSSPPPQRRTACAHTHTHTTQIHARKCTRGRAHTHASSVCLGSGMDVSGSQECARRFLCIFHIRSSLGTALKAALRTAATRVGSVRQ